jgi:hypothetical protein
MITTASERSRGYDDEDALKKAGDTPYTQFQYFSNQADTDAVYLGSNGNARHISQDEFAAGVVDEYLRGPESPLNEKEKGRSATKVRVAAGGETSRVELLGRTLWWFGGRFGRRR